MTRHSCVDLIQHPLPFFAVLLRKRIFQITDVSQRREFSRINAKILMSKLSLWNLDWECYRLQCLHGGQKQNTNYPVTSLATLLLLHPLSLFPLSITYPTFRQEPNLEPFRAVDWGWGGGEQGSTCLLSVTSPSLITLILSLSLTKQVPPLLSGYRTRPCRNIWSYFSFYWLVWHCLFCLHSSVVFSHVVYRVPFLIFLPVRTQCSYFLSNKTMETLPLPLGLS